MRKRAKLLLFLFLGIPVFGFSQTDSVNHKVEVDMGADLFSRYIWRGSQFGGNSPSIQPTISATYKNLEVGIWGAYSVGGLNQSQETDLYLTYSILDDKVSFTVTDYFFPSDSGNYHYLDYNNNSTGHIFEGGISFNGTKKIPVSVSAYVNVYGADAPVLGSNPNDTSTFNQKIGIQYSNYFEIGYSTTVKQVDIQGFVGMTFNTPKSPNNTTGFIGENGFYGNYPGVINIGITASKTLTLTDKYALPLTSSFIINPQTQKVYFIFGISF